MSMDQSLLSCLKGILLRDLIKSLVNHFASVLGLQMLKIMYSDTTTQIQIIHLVLPLRSSPNHYFSLQSVRMGDCSALTGVPK